MTLQVFISYKSEYRDFARSVKNTLNEWGYQTWLDVDKIQPGDYFRHKIQEGLDTSDILLMVLTEEAQLSREVMAEVDYFLDVAKKPVVPLRHRECKPLYIFVSIQYIDFVTNQENGFVQLKQRLVELAQPTVPILEEFMPEPLPEETAAPGGAMLDDAFEQATDRKKEAIKDSLFGSATAPAFPPPQAQPAPSQPITGTNIPVPSAPITQPPRQSDFPQQPAPVRSKRATPFLWPLAAAIAGLVIVVGAVALLNTTANVSATPQPQATSPLLWIIGAVALVGAIGLVSWRRFGQTRRTLPYAKPAPAEIVSESQKPMVETETDWIPFVLSVAEESHLATQSVLQGAIIRHKDFGDSVIPANSTVLDVLYDLNGELLVLGGLEATQKILHQLHGELSPLARQGLSIPVMLNVATWRMDQMFADWLIEALNSANHIPSAVTKGWLENENLLLLLSGFNRLSDSSQTHFLNEFNHFRQRHRAVDFALCGQSTDFEVLTSALDIRGAIVLETVPSP